MVRSKGAQPEEGEFGGSPSQISPGSLPSFPGVTGSREIEALEGERLWSVRVPAHAG